MIPRSCTTVCPPNQIDVAYPMQRKSALQKARFIHIALSSTGGGRELLLSSCMWFGWGALCILWRFVVETKLALTMYNYFAFMGSSAPPKKNGARPWNI